MLLSSYIQKVLHQQESDTHLLWVTNFPGNKFSSQHAPFLVCHKALILTWLFRITLKSQNSLRTSLICTNNKSASSTAASFVMGLTWGLHNPESRDPFTEQTENHFCFYFIFFFPLHLSVTSIKQLFLVWAYLKDSVCCKNILPN